MATLKNVEGTCYSYQDLKFYAMNGYICLHDEKDGDFRVLTCREWLLRGQAFVEEIKRLRIIAAHNSDKRKVFYEDIQRLQTLVDNIIASTMEAKNQGDHDDPAVSAWFQRHRPWARGRTRQNNDPAKFETAKPGPLPLGNFTGRTTGPGEKAPRPSRKLLLPGAPAPTGKLRKLLLPDGTL